MCPYCYGDFDASDDYCWYYCPYSCECEDDTYWWDEWYLYGY